jgi:trk system potassium uptake protein TrkA
VRLVGLRALKGGLLVGQELRNLREHLPNVDSRVIAIFRNGRSVKPEGDAVVESGDEVFFLAATKDIRRVMSEMRRLEDPAKNVVIAGGGNIGLRLAQELEGENQVKLIERDPVRARRISEQLRNAIVLSGDAADEELLVEENIDSADTFVALTNSEEANILSAMLAKRLGCAKVMALITKPAYAELMESGPMTSRSAADDDRFAARLCAARRHRARPLVAARCRRGDGSDRARQPRRSGRRPPRRGNSAAGRGNHRRHRARR